MQIATAEREADDYGDGELFILRVKTEKETLEFNAGHGEPEDFYLFRDLNFVYTVPGMIKAAYEAGKNGEPFEEVEYKLGRDDYEISDVEDGPKE